MKNKVTSKREMERIFVYDSYISQNSVMIIENLLLMSTFSKYSFITSVSILQMFCDFKRMSSTVSVYHNRFE